MDDILHCKCGTRVVETRLGRNGKGPITELRCPSCQVRFYIDRSVWKKANRLALSKEPSK